MVEVLSVVASGIAVAQLDDQIFCSIRNIHNFWQLIRDAPKDLNDSLEKLEILRDTLLELQKILAIMVVLSCMARLLRSVYSTAKWWPTTWRLSLSVCSKV
jgi:hypothetical protein